MEQYEVSNDDTPGRWRCWDKWNGIICKFQDKKFNETQQTDIADFALFMRVNSIQHESIAVFYATAAREMADWLLINHPEKLS